MHIHSVGIDLGKTTFHLVGTRRRRQVLVRKKFTRKQLLAYTANMPAIGAGYLIASQLFGVRPWNPLLLGGATVLLGLAALVAAAIPARRAASVDPMHALRSE